MITLHPSMAKLILQKWGIFQRSKGRGHEKFSMEQAPGHPFLFASLVPSFSLSPPPPPQYEFCSDWPVITEHTYNQTIHRPGFVHQKAMFAWIIISLIYNIFLYSNFTIKSVIKMFPFLLLSMFHYILQSSAASPFFSRCYYPAQSNHSLPCHSPLRRNL